MSNSKLMVLLRKRAKQISYNVDFMLGLYELLNQDIDMVDSGTLSMFRAKNRLLAANLQTLFVFIALENYSTLNAKYIAHTYLKRMAISVVGVKTGN